MREPYTFEIQDQRYQCRRMSAMVQMQVVRRVTPILMGVVPALLDQMRARQEALTKKSGTGEAGEAGEAAPTSILDMDMSVLRDTVLPALQNASEHLSGMPDAEFEFVMHSCLSLVSRERDGGAGWVPIWNTAARQPQFDDMDGSTLLLIMVEVLKIELTPFMTGLASSL